MGDPPDGEIRAGATLVAADDDAFERLRALALTLDDLRAHTHGIARVERFNRSILREFDEIANIHDAAG